MNLVLPIYIWPILDLLSADEDEPRRAVRRGDGGEEQKKEGRVSREVHQVVFGCPFFRKLIVSAPGISRGKVNIFWDGGDFPHGAHDILAPQPEAKNWPPGE